MAGERSAAQNRASLKNLEKARKKRRNLLRLARGGGAPLRSARKRVFTNKNGVKRLTHPPENDWLKGLSYRHARTVAKGVYSQTGGNLQADRNWRGRLVPMAVWRKGKNPLRYDLGMKRNKRMVRIFD